MNHFAFIMWRKKYFFVLSLFPSLVMLPCVNCSDSSPFPGTGQGCVRDTRQGTQGPALLICAFEELKAGPGAQPAAPEEGRPLQETCVPGEAVGPPPPGCREGRGVREAGGGPRAASAPPPPPRPGAAQPPPPGAPGASKPGATADTAVQAPRDPAPAGRETSLFREVGNSRGSPGRGPGPPPPRGELRTRPPAPASARRYDLARPPPPGRGPPPPRPSPGRPPPSVPLRPSPAPGPAHPQKPQGQRGGRLGALLRSLPASPMVGPGRGAAAGGGRAAPGRDSRPVSWSRAAPLGRRRRGGRGGARPHPADGSGRGAERRRHGDAELRAAAPPARRCR